jgi:hypothetical protein
MMKKLFVLLLTATSFTAVFGQNQPSKKNKVDISNRSADHFVLQYGSDSWGSVPDSIRTGGGFSRHFNMYFMLDKPSKGNPNFSVAFGAGISSSNIFFKNQYIDLKANNTATLPFRPLIPGTDTNTFSKYKLTTIFLEAPIELRFSQNPATPNKGLKAAIGVKIGTLLKAHTKGKDQRDEAGNSVYGNRYIVKESDKKFFNGTRLSATGRIGWGNFSLHAAYSITTVLKDGAGAEIRPFSIGLTISGL